MSISESDVFLPKDEHPIIQVNVTNDEDKKLEKTVNSVDNTNKKTKMNAKRKNKNEPHNEAEKNIYNKDENLLAKKFNHTDIPTLERLEIEKRKKNYLTRSNSTERQKVLSNFQGNTVKNDCKPEEHFSKKRRSVLRRSKDENNIRTLSITKRPDT